MRMPKIHLTLTTREERKGTQWLESGEPMVWSAEGDDETVEARFEHHHPDGLVRSYTISGDDWRAIEDQGELPYVSIWVRRGCALHQAVPAAVDACDPSGYNNEYERSLEEKDAIIDQLRESLFALSCHTKNTAGARKALQEATKVWKDTAHQTVKDEVLRRARFKNDDIETFEDAVMQYGTSMVIEVEKALV